MYLFAKIQLAIDNFVIGLSVTFEEIPSRFLKCSFHICIRSFWLAAFSFALELLFRLLIRFFYLILTFSHWLCVRIYVYIYTHTPIYIYIYTHLYVYICLCVYLCVCLYIYIYIYISSIYIYKLNTTLETTLKVIWRKPVTFWKRA